jgi:putative membrane protein
VTLGFFLFVVNAICFGLTAALVPGFDLSGFSAAFFGALVVTLVSWVVSALIADAQKQ